MTESEKNRDRLAAERTHLANERTLLAYVRTALAMAAAGAAILQFYPSREALRIAAWALVGGGGAMVVFGCLRFVSVRRSVSGE
jgi:putative membrane protein